MGTGTHASRKRNRRQAHPDAVSTGDPADQNSRQHELVGRGHRGCRRERYLELVDAVLGMELFDVHPGGRHRGHDVSDERFMLEHTGKPVLRPQLPR